MFSVTFHWQIIQEHDKYMVSCVYVCVFQSGQFSEDMIPTVGFNMRKITKGNVTIKVGGPFLQSVLIQVFSQCVCTCL